MSLRWEGASCGKGTTFFLLMRGGCLYRAEGGGGGSCRGCGGKKVVASEKGLVFEEKKGLCIWGAGRLGEGGGFPVLIGKKGKGLLPGEGKGVGVSGGEEARVLAGGGGCLKGCVLVLRGKTV